MARNAKNRAHADGKTLSVQKKEERLLNEMTRLFNELAVLQRQTAKQKADLEKTNQRLHEVQAALAHQATHDALTGIFNRRAILDQLARELARGLRLGGRLSVGMCDIDHFKEINDRFGHQAGDEVLVAFARCLQDNLREYDYVGRYGGEEFLVIASGATGQSDDGLYNRLRQQVAALQVKTTTGASVSITVSIGTAPGAAESTVNALLAAADEALYRAKAAGRDRVVRSQDAESGDKK